MLLIPFSHRVFVTEPVIVTSGIILRCFFIVAYAYFIATTYISQRDITFISLDPTSGICVNVPIAITNTYTMDLHGNWDGSLSYNPTQGMYSVTMNNFLHTNADYQKFMKSSRYAFENQLSFRAPHQELSTNLLEWMTYSYFVDDGTYAHRFRAVGDPKQVFHRQSYIGSIGNSQSDCTLAGD